MQLINLKASDIDQQQWDSFVRSSDEGMIYSLHSFLSAVEPDWEAYIVVLDGRWQLIFPFKRSKKYGLKYFLQPKFTQFLGPVFSKYEGKRSKQLQWKNKLLSMLTVHLKKEFHYLNFNTHPDFDYALPFSWKKFRMSPKFTYQLQLKDTSLAELEQGVSKGKVQLHKATRAGVRFENANDPSAILSLFGRVKQKDISHLGAEDYQAYGRALVSFIESGECEVVEAFSNDGELIGGMILYYYQGVCTYAFSVSDPIYSSLSLGHCLIWQCILRAKKRDLSLLDFEGSMIPQIERLFRRFGAKPKPYLNIQFAKLRFLYRS
jgi:hypothetical protein